MEVKDVIRNNRIELGLTMKEVADKVGVSEATVSRWESGDIENMRRDKISALSKALRIPLEILMGWDMPSRNEIENDVKRIQNEIATRLNKDESELILKMAKSKEKERMLSYIKKVLEIEDMEKA